MLNGRKYEYVVIGAGPAALQLGYYFQRSSMDYVLLERNSRAGSFFDVFPRHRKLISINKVHTGYDDSELNMRWDWNSLLSDDFDVLFSSMSKDYFPNADTMVSYLNRFADYHGINVEYDRPIKKVSKMDSGFRLLDEAGYSIECEKLIIATGVSKSYMPNIEGIELAEKYEEVSVDPAGFENERVLIIGKGNSAFETADNLVGSAAIIHLASPNPVVLAWQSHFVGNVRAVNNDFLDTYQLKSQNAVLDATIEKIEKKSGRFHVDMRYTHADGEKETLTYDRVIVCAGFRFDASIFDESCTPKLTINNKFPKLTSSWESENVKNLYFCGTITQSLDYKKSTSGFIHGFRYNARALSRVIAAECNDMPWPSRRVPVDPKGIAEVFMARMNSNSGLWQQFGFLCDLLIVDEDGGVAEYFEEVPVGYFKEGDWGDSHHCYSLMFEYGEPRSNPFNVNRMPVPEKADQSFAIHPVIRRYSQGSEIAVHHVLEHLFGEWKLVEEHEIPLVRFFESQLSELCISVD